MTFKDTEIGLIPEDWGLEEISDYAIIITDYVANGSFASLSDNVNYLEEEDYAVLLRLVDYNNNFEGKFVFINEHSYNFLKKTKLYGGEIIISNVGANVGTVFRTPKLKYKMNLGPNTIMIRTKGVDDFYYYWFTSSIGQGYIKSIITGSAQPKFNKTNFRKLKVPVPPLQEQKAIAHILSTLDQKIEINNRINKTLEEMAQTIFKHWFVDFEFPNEDGEPYKSSGGEMVDSELGPIPKGWEIVELSELIELVKESTKTGEHLIGKPYNPIDTLPMRSVVILESNDSSDAKSSLLLFRKFDILVGAMRVYFHRVCIAPYDGITRATTFVLRSKIEDDIPYNLFLINQNETIDYATNSSKGSTMPYAVWENGLGNMKVIRPPADIRKLYYNAIMPTLEKMITNATEINKLSLIRDTLLPKLMSGEIRVPIDIEEK